MPTPPHATYSLSPLSLLATWMGLWESGGKSPERSDDTWPDLLVQEAIIAGTSGSGECGIEG